METKHQGERIQTVSQAITALEAIRTLHGDLPLASGWAGGHYYISVTIWDDDGRKESGFTKEELKDGVMIEDRS